jgi:hypothetical protein
MSLIRNISLYKINSILGLKSLSLLSENGESIFVLIHADENQLKKEAERIEFPLQFEIGITDLISLEPCDRKWHPYRFVKEGKPHDINNLEKNLTDFMILLYQDDYDSIIKQQIDEQPPINEKEWRAYRSFLTYIHDNKQEFLKIICSNLEIKGVIAKEIFNEAITYAHQETGYKLKNLWDFFETHPIGAYSEYFKQINEVTKVDKTESIYIIIY